jgi:predicted permease
MNSIAVVENFMRDVIHGLRNLRRSPGFTAVAIISLALGIGANSAILSLVDTLMLRWLPVQRPKELVQLAMLPTEPPAAGEKAATPSGSFSYPIVEAIRDRNSVFSGMFAYGGQGVVTIQIEGRSEQVAAERVGGEYFSVLGVSPVFGRTFTAAEDVPGAEPVAVISYGYWQRRFGFDPQVIGKHLSAGRTIFTIAGVAPPRFIGFGVDYATDLWIPYTATTPANRLRGAEAHKEWSARVVARLKPGISSQQALPSLNVLFTQIMQNEEAIFAATDTGRRIPEARRHRDYARKLTLLSGGHGISGLRQQFTEPLTVLLIVAGLVLLIACANIANLLLARATARRREMAVRLAMGAGRARLVMQLLTEGLLLSFLGALAGLVFAFWATHTLVRMVVGEAATNVEFQLDWRMLAFTAGVAVCTGVLFSLGPALGAVRLNLTPALKNETAAARGTRLPAARIIIIAQIALSLPLLLASVLLVTTLNRLRYQDLGYRPESLLIAGVDLDQGFPTGPQMLIAFRDLQDRVSALPGVTAASISDRIVFGRGAWTEPVYSDAGRNVVHSNLQFIAPNFLETMRTPLLAGRAFTPRDNGTSPKVAIIDQVLARTLYPDTSAVGKRLGWKPGGPFDVEIVGVVADVKKTLREAAPPFVFLPLMQPQTSPYGRPNSSASLLVRTQLDPAGLIEPIRRELQEGSSSRPGMIRTYTSIIDDSLRQERMLAQISGFFGAAGLMLAAIGLYGLMAYVVSRRTGEMGIRMALGANPGDLVRMILRESTLLVGAGVAAGIAIAMVATRIIESFLFGVKPADPQMVTIAAAMLAAVGLAAAWIPALRASRVSPMTALRHE